ncbi:MAG: hypothetical protein HZA94_02230 [Candidatus Vogelbacteria bacterium]|nr:hypothetical protein [Candidatus Vogelbacteria bacterium]
MKTKILFSLAVIFLNLDLSLVYGHGRYSGSRYTDIPNRTGAPCIQERTWRPYIHVPYVVYYFPQTRIPVDIITAEGTKIRDGWSTRVTFYMGRYSNGDTWCQVGVTPARFQIETDAIKWVEESFGLSVGSLRQIERRSAGPPWFVSN